LGDKKKDGAEKESSMMKDLREKRDKAGRNQDKKKNMRKGKSLEL